MRNIRLMKELINLEAKNDIENINRETVDDLIMKYYHDEISKYLHNKNGHIILLY